MTQPMAQMPMTQTPPDDRRPRRRRKALALLSAGVVLGIGAVVTLAVWNDPEFAQGTFTTQEFDIEGSLDGDHFSSSPTSPGKTLAFSIPASAMSPGDRTYAPFAVQLSERSGHKASVALSHTATVPFGNGLVFSLYALDGWDKKCSAAEPPETAIIEDRPVTTTGSVHVFNLVDPLKPVHLCFVVRGTTSLPQGATGTVTWQFTGTSTDPIS